MPKSEVFNCDCMAYMKTLPDNYFELMIADPAYGDGLHAENGGGKGWFTKYNQKAEDSVYNTEHRNLRGRFDRYNDATACSQFLNVERERERERENKSRSITVSEAPEADLNAISVARTGGTWAEKYGKKLSRGTLPHRKITSKKCSASHAIKSFGAAIIFGSRRPAAF